MKFTTFSLIFTAILLFSPMETVAAEHPISTTTLACPQVYQLKAINRVGGLIRTTSAFGYQGSNWLVTTGHSIRDAHRVVAVAPDGRQLELRWQLAEDRRNDLVVLSHERPSEAQSNEIAGTLRKFVAAPTGSAVSDLMVHAWVPALGRLAVPGRAVGVTQIFNREVFELDIPLTPGMSGGAVVDQQCRLLGIVSFGIEAGTRRAFATPAPALLQLYANPMNAAYKPDVETASRRLF